ncbi:hypothetical protein CO051_04210 [Candidatus Roizmanbacteria bacterium CG_4_9_14_0_2_um_filter_39_13]|uniref:Uncharacterized protein n=1 Tax=Candidatus Roizmanbacteria bacterium CG_4_9_14_0_2_um_filter_39_13 TaxID=1974839 RepID=A0A2M8EY94_9BACT|nr:MAG: hypothetical protein CO051_04210 [Candidatus Roizmanbacteria bacterium CG_4_9_14_0_2_um_filter_39_13]
MCGAQFNFQEEMDAHAKQMHNKKEEQQEEHAISCSKCGFKASSTTEIEKHTSEMMNDPKHSMTGQM